MTPIYRYILQWWRKRWHTYQLLTWVLFLSHKCIKLINFIKTKTNGCGHELSGLVNTFKNYIAVYKLLWIEPTLNHDGPWHYISCTRWVRIYFCPIPKTCHFADFKDTNSRYKDLHFHNWFLIFSTKYGVNKTSKCLW